jgi:transcriptional regulator with XRE-family HTH domain
MKKKHLRGNSLRKLRKAKGITVTEAADMLKVPYKTYWAWENDKNGIGPLAWESILKELS